MDGSLHIDNLQISDGGNYTCVVSNNLGQDQITYSVKTEVPPKSPALYTVATTSNSISLRWKPAPEHEPNTQGYTIHHKQESSNWATIEIQPYQESWTIENLECGTNYHIFMVAFNKIGAGQPSEKVIVSTNGGAPHIPPTKELILEGTHHVTLALKSWVINECPIVRFVIEYKKQIGKIWHLAAYDIDQEKQEVVLKDLESATWYSLRITAYTTVQSAVANYNFLTQEAEKEETHDSESTNNNGVLEKVDVKLMLIVSTSIIAFVVICVLMACLWIKRMRRVNTRESGANQDHDSRLLPTPRNSVSRNDPRKSVLNSRPLSGYDDDIVPYATAKLSDFDQSHSAAQSMPFLGPSASTQGSVPSTSYNPSAPPFSESYGLYGMTRLNHGTIADGTIPGCGRHRNSQAKRAQETRFMYPTIPNEADGDYDPPPPDLSWLPVKRA